MAWGLAMSLMWRTSPWVNIGMYPEDSTGGPLHVSKHGDSGAPMSCSIFCGDMWMGGGHGRENSWGYHIFFLLESKKDRIGCIPTEKSKMKIQDGFQHPYIHICSQQDVGFCWDFPRCNGMSLLVASHQKHHRDLTWHQQRAQRRSAARVFPWSTLKIGRIGSSGAWGHGMFSGGNICGAPALKFLLAENATNKIEPVNIDNRSNSYQNSATNPLDVGWIHVESSFQMPGEIILNHNLWWSYCNGI